MKQVFRRKLPPLLLKEKNPQKPSAFLVTQIIATGHPQIKKEFLPAQKTKEQTQHVSPDGLWRSFPKAPCLMHYVPSGVYFARVRHKGKLFRQSLETAVGQRISYPRV